MRSRYPVVLASASPRRRELLKEIFEEFKVVAADIDESSGLLPLEARAESLAVGKARAVADAASLVIGADTIVGIGDKSLGKPESPEEAVLMLRTLSGCSHRVITGVALVWPEGEKSFYDVTEVTFRPLEDREIEAYVATGEPMDKAGAYAIQGGASGFADKVDGSLDTVIGLPVDMLRSRLLELGLLE